MSNRNRKFRGRAFAPGVLTARFQDQVVLNIRKIASVPTVNAEQLEPYLQSSKPLLMIFSADWCIPCRKFLGKPDPNHHNLPDLIEGRPPAYAQREGQPGFNFRRILDIAGDKADVVIIDIQASPELKTRFEIEEVPKLVFRHPDGRLAYIDNADHIIGRSPEWFRTQLNMRPA